MTATGCHDLVAVARVFHALASPARLRLLARLTDGPCAVGELATAARLKQANTSKHLGVLHAAGAVRSDRTGSRVVYAVADPTVAEVLRRAGLFDRHHR